MLFILTMQSDTKCWLASAQKHALLARITSTAVTSFSLCSSVSPCSTDGGYHGSGGDHHPHSTCRWKHARTSPVPAPVLDPLHPGFESTCRAMNLHKQHQSWKRQRSSGNSHQSWPEASPTYPLHKSSISLQGNNRQQVGLPQVKSLTADHTQATPEKI